MWNVMRGLGERKNALWRDLLQLDNYLIGLFICAFAAYEWLAVYDGIGQAKLYFPQRIYALPSLSILNTLFSAVYLTMAAIILLSLRQPLSRYNTALPNLISVLAAFAVYLFVLVPSGDLLQINAGVSLALIVSGSLIIITSLIFLRQAFSVTPQARFLVTAGPYALMRHPMYVGNILSILGLALLIDSAEAMVLFVICSALQIARALLEEKLLYANLPGYADYKKRVGRFYPRFPARRAIPAAICCLLLLPRPGVAGSITPGSGLQGQADRAPAIAVASRIDWAKKCTDWNRKAAQSALYTSGDLLDMEKADSEALKAIPACKAFYDLYAACSSMSEAWGNSELGDEAFITKIEAGPVGCKSVVATDVCAALKKIAQNGVRLADSRQAFMAQCLQVDIVNRRFEQIRPGM